MDNNLLIDNIRNLCKKNKVSISKLENDLFLSPGLISRWNKNMPSLDKIADIADYFGVSIDELIGRSSSLSNTNNIGRFLILLYQQSINEETVWEILNPQSLPKKLSDITLPKNFTSNLYGSYYTIYNDGFFILTANRMPSSALNLTLYVLPDIDSRFECICSDAARLTRLYEFLERRFRSQLNTIKAHNLIHSYLQENTVAELSENEKISLLADINKASNY